MAELTKHAEVRVVWRPAGSGDPWEVSSARWDYARIDVDTLREYVALMNARDDGREWALQKRVVSTITDPWEVTE